MNEQNQHSEQLFQQMEDSRTQRAQVRKRRLLIGVGCGALVLVVGFFGLRAMVKDRFGGDKAEVLSYQADRTTISSTVSGSGALAAVGLESIVLPAGVEVTKVMVTPGAQVSQGDVLATVNMATVISTLDELQQRLNDLDTQLGSAKGDTVSSNVTAGIKGRVKAVYAKAGDTVASVMAEHGALAVLSLDGSMAVTMETDRLAAGEQVTVIRESGGKLTGTVEQAVAGTAVILVTDNGPKSGENVTILDSDGNTLGTGTLEIHAPLAVTAVAGTVSSVGTRENAYVYAGSHLFYLKDTAYSANYDTLLRQRQALEETLLELLKVYRDGAVLAAFDSTVSSVEYDADTVAEDADTALLTLYPNKTMSITLPVDEDDILSLAVGQTAEVTVSSVGDEKLLGTVTQVDRTATSGSGVTYYAATVEVGHQEGMLEGMTAQAAVRISGVDNAVVVPIEAVHQTSNISFVYTTYDERTETYGGRKEVVTGLSNDDYVEIISGLAEGETVYYTREAESFFNMMGGFGGEIPSGEGGGRAPGRGEGGTMPDRGQMPTGAGRGGGK